MAYRGKFMALAAALIGAAFCGCGDGGEDVVTGDLAFLMSSEGQYSEAISASTGRQGKLPFTHVGIVIAKDGEPDSVIEAVPDSGVRVIPYSRFAKSGDVVRLMRVDGCSEEQLKTMVDAAREKLGRPYDLRFMPGDSAYYCSELVTECYAIDGKQIFDNYPMTFLDSLGNTPPYWVEYFSRLAMPVPEGVPGSNPARLSNDKRLRIIKR